MPLFELSHFWIIFLDIFVWLVIHLGVSYLCSLIPISYFEKDIWWYRTRSWEKGGMFYQRQLRIKSWRKVIPDGGALFKRGFPKKNLECNDTGYLKTFLYETKRAELTHLLAIVPAPIFFLWNIWWVGLVMIAYALIANLPCIMLQRFNRARISRVLKIAE
jgi:glycosyl-4,4'-diaponeurosporenoate acyltransferase